jgi:hypothetical protein
MLAVIILAVAVLSRFIDHAPNFTPTIALALFGGVYLPRKYTIIVPLLFMLLSDLVLGFHHTMFFTWGSVVLISVFGVWMRQYNKFSNFLMAGTGSAVLFFIVTNLGAWPSLYAVTWQGLTECFIAAIPFFRNTFVSTIIYSTVLYATYELIASRLKSTRWAQSWLTV